MNQFILCLLFCIIAYVMYKFYSYNRQLRYTDFGDDKSNIKVCFIAGVHGNEPAGSLLLEDMIKTTYFKDFAEQNGIFIRVIPSVNEFGLTFGVRVQNNIFNPDINRTFGGENGSENSKISKEMVRLTSDMNFIVDFHEGWGFHRINSSSLGSTLTVTEQAKKMGEMILQNVNQIIANDKHKFMILDRMCNIPSAFSCFCNKKGKRYILVETSGQRDVQPIHVRQDQIKIIIDTVLKNIKII